MKVPKIKIASVPKKNRIRDLTKMQKISEMVNRNSDMESAKDRANLFDSRPLKSGAYNKFKDTWILFNLRPWLLLLQVRVSQKDLKWSIWSL